MTGYEAYCLHIALKNHFTTEKYDYFKYNGKVNISKEAYLSNKDRFLYEKLARQEKDLEPFILASILKDRVWLRDLLEDEAGDIYTEYQRVMQSLSYTFRNEIDKVEDLAQLFKSKSKEDYPPIITMCMNGELSIQTTIILNQFVQFIPEYDKKYGDDFIWSKISLKLRKYKPFLLREINDMKIYLGILKSHGSVAK